MYSSQFVTQKTPDENREFFVFRCYQVLRMFFLNQVSKRKRFRGKILILSILYFPKCI